jgi:hypothetical protein
MADALNALLKAECIRNPVLRGSGWRCIDDVERAVATYIDWYKHRRPWRACLRPTHRVRDHLVGKHHDQQLP